MFRFFRRHNKPSSVPDGKIIYAVGDIHGRADLLESLLKKIEADRGRHPGADAEIIFLGDYVDRGPDSRAVLDQLISLSDRQATIFIKGNHEQALTGFLEDPEWGPRWGEFGGAETLRSYGIAAPDDGDPVAWRQASEALRDALPKAHRRFLDGLLLWVERGDYFFTHAGVRPGLSLNAQSEEDLLWIRDEFLDDRRRFEKVIVHGHTPHNDVYRDNRRIALDTGAYISGRLSAARFEGGTVAYIQVAANT